MVRNVHCPEENYIAEITHLRLFFKHTKNTVSRNVIGGRGEMNVSLMLSTES